jgi:tripartite-type tricarboxylate transporter receptor subunit TctC
MSDIKEKLATLGTLPHPMGPEAFGTFLAKENARWSEAVRSAGVTVE